MGSTEGNGTDVFKHLIFRSRLRNILMWSSLNQTSCHDNVLKKKKENHLTVKFDLSRVRLMSLNIVLVFWGDL